MARMTKEERCNAFIRDYKSRGPGWPMFAIEEQDRREGPLVEALRKLAVLGNGNMPGNSEGNVIAQHALAAYDALDAKPEPTLLEAAKAITTPQPFRNEINGVLVDGVMWEALKAAVEREERCAGERKSK